MCVRTETVADDQLGDLYTWRKSKEKINLSLLRLAEKGSQPDLHKLTFQCWTMKEIALQKDLYLFQIRDECATSSRFPARGRAVLGNGSVGLPEFETLHTPYTHCV